MKDKEFKNPEPALPKDKRDKLDKILQQIRGTKKFLTRNDFLMLLDLAR